MRLYGFMSMAATVIVTGFASTISAQPAPAAPAATTPTSDHGKGMGMMGGTCPMLVPGTTVTTADVEGGAAISFTTSTGDVAELRQRVRRMAEMHNQGHGQCGMMMGGPRGADAVPGGHHHGGGAAHGHGGGGGRTGARMMPAAICSVEDIEGGARLILRPKDPALLDAVRERARTQAARMAQGECPMMVH